MAVHNADIARVFDEIADLLEIQGENPFRIPDSLRDDDVLVLGETERLRQGAAIEPAAVRAVVLGDGIFVSGEGELLYPQDRTFLVIELDELIERHGMQAAARDFTGRARA